MVNIPIGPFLEANRWRDEQNTMDEHSNGNSTALLQLINEKLKQNVCKNSTLLTEIIVPIKITVSEML